MYDEEATNEEPAAVEEPAVVEEPVTAVADPDQGNPSTADVEVVDVEQAASAPTVEAATSGDAPEVPDLPEGHVWGADVVDGPPSAAQPIDENYSESAE